MHHGKLEKVEKFLQDPVDARVTLAIDKDRQIAELFITHKMGLLKAREESRTMEEAVQLVVDKVETQARRGAERLKDHRRRGSEPIPHGAWPVDVLEMKADEGPRIIRSSHLRIKPMAVEEAALQLESSKNDFLVFRDAESQRLQVLYKRRDGNYGLIAPEL
ncbi:MAG: HPF/RaiA family ribosome-associated protein [Acidobacteriota bacterium]